MMEVLPTGPCGLGGVSMYAECVSDECTSDGDCKSGELCTPPGLRTVRQCMPASCRRDSDCTAEAGGACVVFGGACCFNTMGPGTFRPEQLACAYPSDGCQSDADCTGASCVVSDGRAHCASKCE
ncbi:MAG TPA: hypothetical protein VHW01_06350 [Polyangiaceae bacterium]|nr:hypothetical protein [Polyangiaceae bacterium]